MNAVVPARGNNGHPGEWVSSKVTNIQKVGQIQGDVDMSVAQAARDLDIHENLLRK